MRFTSTIITVLILFFIVLPARSQVINMRDITQDWKTDLKNRKVELNEFRALLKRDAIPPIDEPEFWDSKKAFKTYFNNEPLTVVESNGESKSNPSIVLLM